MTNVVGEIWSDIHSSITVDARGSIKKAVNVDAVISSIDNILRTRPGERVMLPTFGAGMSDLLFEPTDLNAYDDIEDRLRRSIAVWDDRVNINNVSFEVDADRNQVTVKMSFAIRGYEQIFEHSTVLMGA